MTWPHADPGEALTREQQQAIREARGCGGCLYLAWGPGIRAACTHPEHCCWDAASLSLWCLGCSDRVPRDGGQIHEGDPARWPEPVRLRAWVEQWTEARLTERRAQRRAA